MFNFQSDDSSEVDSSRKKLMSTPDTSYIDMNLTDKVAKPKSSGDEVDPGCFCLR